MKHNNSKVKTTPENVKEANEALFKSTMNLPEAAAHCGMTQKEMKMTFREFMKYHPPEWDTFKSVHDKSTPELWNDIVYETTGGF